MPMHRIDRQGYYIIAFCVALVIAAVFALFRYDGCNHSVGGNIITRDTLLKIIQLPPQTDTVTATLTVVRKSRTTDTLTIVKIDSFFRDLPPFSLRGAEFVTAKKDTITAQYRYPANQFEYEARYSPDTVLTITTREYIKPDKVQFGVQGGVGAAVGFDGIVRPAVFVGLGVNYKF